VGRFDGKIPIIQYYLDSLILKDRTDRMPRNVDKELPIYAV
jgi:hypothetical protein